MRGHCTRNDTLKEELAYATDEWLQDISNTMLLNMGIPLRN